MNLFHHNTRPAFLLLSAFSLGASCSQLDAEMEPSATEHLQEKSDAPGNPTSADSLHLVVSDELSEYMGANREFLDTGCVRMGSEFAADTGDLALSDIKATSIDDNTVELRLYWSNLSGASFLRYPEAKLDILGSSNAQVTPDYGVVYYGIEGCESYEEVIQLAVPADEARVDLEFTVGPAHPDSGATFGVKGFWAHFRVER